MSTTKIIALAIGIFTLIAAGLLGYAAIKRSSDARQAEQTFMRDIVAHHQAAIQLARTAKEQASQDDVRATADSIIATHQQDITTILAWYRKWYKTDVPKSVSDPHAGHQPESNATTVEQGFAGIMIPHQQKGIDIARAVIGKAKHPEVTSLAYMIVDRLSAEIVQLKPYQPKSKPISAGSIVTVMYNDEGFDKPQLSVPVGATVTFMNMRNGRPMWVASNVHPNHQIYPEFDQGRALGYEPLPQDSQFSFKFTRKGQWMYHDHYDPDKQGKIIVN